MVLLSTGVMFLAWRLADARAHVRDLTAREAAQSASVAALPGVRPEHAGTPEGYAEQTAAFAAARDFYGRRMRWMATDGDQVEFGMSGGKMIVMDEMLTPDSSRFWPVESYAPGGSPPSFDKQFVRDYLLSIKWDKKPPAPRLPEEIIKKTTDKYVEALGKITGETLEV